MNLKTSKRGFKEGNYESKLLRSSAVMVIHCYIWFEQKSQLCGILKHLFLNEYAEFDSKISHIMFLNDNLLVCEISTVGTLTLIKKK